MGTTESLLYDDRPPDESDIQAHPAVVSHSSERRLPGNLPNQSTTPGPQPKKPTRPITRLTGVVVGGPKVGKRTLLQRLEGIDPFAHDANNTDFPSSVTIAYKPPAGMPTWNRIQLHVEKGNPNAFPKVDFVLLLLRLSRADAEQEIHNMMHHVLEIYLQNLGYTRNDESNNCCAPVCICVLYNFRDLNAEQEMNSSEDALKETLESFLKTILKQYSIPSDRLILQFLSTSLRNGYGLDHLHHYIYRTYLQKKREALEAQLRAVKAQISQTTQTDFVPYQEFLKQLSPSDRNGSPSNKVENRPSKRVVTKEKETAVTSRPDEETRSRSRSIQQQPTPSSVTTSKPLPVDPQQLPVKTRNDRGATSSTRRQIYPQAKQPIQLDQNALEAFLGGDSSDEDRVPRKHRKEKSSKKQVSGRVTESSDDDDDDFFYDEKGHFTNRKGKGYNSDDSSSSSSSSSSRQDSTDAPATNDPNARKRATKPAVQGVQHPNHETPSSEPGEPTKRPAIVEQSNNERVTDEVPSKEMPAMRIDKTVAQSLMQNDQTKSEGRRPIVVTPGKKESQEDSDSDDDEFFINDSSILPNTVKIEPEDETNNEHVQSPRTAHLDNNPSDDGELKVNRARQERYTNIDENSQNEEPDIPATPHAVEATTSRTMDDCYHESNSEYDSKTHDIQQQQHEATSEHAATSTDKDEDVQEVHVNDNAHNASKGANFDTTEIPAERRPGDKPSRDASESTFHESTTVVPQDPKTTSRDECYTDKRIESAIQHSPDDNSDDDEEFFIGEEKIKDDSKVDATPPSGSLAYGDEDNNDSDDDEITRKNGWNPIRAPHDDNDNNEEDNQLANTDDQTRTTPLGTQKSTCSSMPDEDSDNDEFVVNDQARMIESTPSSRPSSSLDITTDSSKTGGDTTTTTTISAPTSGISAAALAAIQAAQREAEAMLLQSMESDKDDTHQKPKKAKKEKKQKKDGAEKKKKKKKDKSSRKDRSEEVDDSD